jgi:polyisoprenoid-binding protein YceI
MSQNDSALNGEWDLDPTHTRIGFSARHAMVTTVRGSFNEIEGSFHADLDDMSNSSARVVLKTASVDTRNTQRDDHLRSGDFFDVEKWPDITFQSTLIEEVEDNAYMVSGDLTIRDVTRQIVIPLALVGVERDSFGLTRAGFEGSRRINRRDFGLVWNMPLDSGGLMVSERIMLEFEISAVKRVDEASGADGESQTEQTEQTEQAGEATEGQDEAQSEQGEEPDGQDEAQAEESEESKGE